MATQLKILPTADVNISDTTIRDGCQMPGIHMTETQKLGIYDYLHRIGIEKIECFLFSDSDKKVASMMLERDYSKPEVTGWARANESDINEVLTIGGIKETGILMSISDAHIYKKLGLTRESAESKYLSALAYALDKGLKARCHLEDCTNSDFEGFTLPFVEKILKMYPDAMIRFCDTLGIGLPDPGIKPPRGVPQSIKRLKELGVRSIETHMHDDLGNAVGNSLIGFEYGANWTSATFLGIGERAGNAELEKILINLYFTEGLQNKYDLSCLAEFAEFMETGCGIYVPRNKAVVGKNIFTHESGIHTAGVIREPTTYEPFPPELVGGRRELRIGPTSGGEVIAYKVNEVLEGLKSDLRVDKKDPRIGQIYGDIKKIYAMGDRRKETSLSYDEVISLMRKYDIL